ncbi:MAG: DUF3592 domain-containing protein [Bacteroidota bacterium]
MNVSNWSGSRFGGIIVLAIGLFFGAFATWMVLDAKKYSDNGIAASGTVVENLRTRGQKGGTIYTPIVSFKTKEGQEIEFENSVSSSPPEFAIGEKVDVFYMQDNPHDAVIANGIWLLPGIFSGVTAILLIVAAVCFVFDFKNRGKAPEPDHFKDFHKKFDKDFDDDFTKEFDEETKFDTTVEVREFLRKKQKLEAIKHYKDEMGVSLQEATKAVDVIEQEMKIEEMK